MKIKSLSIILVSMLVSMKLMAADVIVGTGTSSACYFPYHTCWKYSMQEYIYKASEIGGAGTINGISFYVNAAKSQTATIKVYLGHTSLTSLSSQITSGMTCVYNSSRTIGGSMGWEKLSFSTPFNYNGNDNLVVIVTKSCSSYDETLTYRYTNGQSTGIYRGSNSTTGYATCDYFGGFYTTYSRPNIKFDIPNYVKGLNIKNISTDYDFTVNNIFYKVESLSDLTCKVVRGNGYTQTALDIPSTVTFNGKDMKVVGIDDYSFAQSDIEDITIPNSVTSIGKSAFDGCWSLTNLSMGNGIKTIGKGAFASCSSLTSVTIPSATEKIDENAFNGCSKLSTVVFEDGETPITLGKNGSFGAFVGLPINNLYIGKNLVYESGYQPFKNNTVLKTLAIGNKVTEFPDNSLSTIISLTELSVGDGLTTIPSFNACINLKKITLGSGLASIPTFNACDVIDTIYLHCYTPQPIENEFANKVYVNSILKVPTGSLTSYQNAEVWKNFWNVSEYSYEGGDAPKTGLRIIRPKAKVRQGASMSLTARMYPEDVICSNVVWKSEDSAIATVSQEGVVSGVGIGSTSIIVTTNDGTNFSDTCTITVVAPYEIGDVNDDGYINVADISGIINFIMETNTENLVYRAADINMDNFVLVDDLTDLITMIMRSGLNSSNSSRRMSRHSQTEYNSNNNMTIIENQANVITIILSDEFDNYSGIQFDLTLPTGYSIEDITSNFACDIQNEWSQIADTEYRIILYSPTNNISGVNDKKNINIRYATPGNEQESQQEFVLHDIVATTPMSRAAYMGDLSFISNNVTSIKSTGTVQNKKSSTIYNLNGQRISYPRKGVYIKDGKIFISK